MKAWFALARPPFHIVGILPFILGTLLAWKLAGQLRLGVLLLGAVGVTLIMLATYLSGEYWDQVEDAISHSRGAGPFAGGSGTIFKGDVEGTQVFAASIACVVAAILVGLALWLWLGTGILTMPFGIMGIIGGFFYSSRPVRWVTRGWGEIWIAFCYGWLPVITGYYLQTGLIPPILHWISLPVALTIFNVILLNEFPDYPADVSSGKRNIAARIGRERAAQLYGAVGIGAWILFLASVIKGVPEESLVAYFPFAGLSAYLVAAVNLGRWRERTKLQVLCGLNIAVNLGTTGAYIVGYLA